MRHRKKFNHLGRKKGHRSSMLANMACSLIEHKRINTTLAKAKALKKFVEPLITKSKSDTTHNRRIVFSRMKQKNAVAELFRDVAVKVADRPGGYTRIIRLGNRLGDNAEMAMIELVDYNDTYVSKKKKTTRRSRRGKKSESVSEEVVNEEVLNDALEVLRNVWKDDVSDVAAIMRTNWLEDPLSFGAYSFPKPDNSDCTDSSLSSPSSCSTNSRHRAVRFIGTSKISIRRHSKRTSVRITRKVAPSRKPSGPPTRTTVRGPRSGASTPTAVSRGQMAQPRES